MSEAKIELGRRLFFDTRLSVDNTYSCASCHKPELAFTDGLARAKGVHGGLHPRNTMSLVNVAYNPVFGWASRETDSLEKQALIPMFNQAPKELGLQEPIDEIIKRFSLDPLTKGLFQQAFPKQSPATSLDTIAKAIAAFERTLIFGNSAYDRYVFLDDQKALTENQKAGMRLFFSQRLGCSQCHGGFNFSSVNIFLGAKTMEPLFVSNGLYDQYLGSEKGLFNESNQSRDVGQFKPPTLRNISLTGPYMHDGSLPNLAAVLDHYGKGNAKLSLKSFRLNQLEKQQLIEFFNALTDQSFMDKK